MGVIKAGYLISYDYEFVKLSLPRIYDFVDEIILAVDKDGLTWSGTEFNIDPSFWEWIKAFDSAKKITIYKDSFYVPGLTPMECDTRERNMLGQQMGICDWYLQIDADEYFVDFEAFIDRLKATETTEPTTVFCRVATLFKEVESGYLLIADSIETLTFATNNPVYDLARTNISGNKHVFFDDLVLHQSWARSPEEIHLKLNNWSHTNDFNIDSFYNLWLAIDAHNYYGLSNFHPLDPVLWPRLELLQGSLTEILDTKDIELINHFKQPLFVKKSFLSVFWKNFKDSLKNQEE